MPAYNQPLPRIGNIQDAWCSTSASVCGQCGAPSIIDNQNLEKQNGGKPGFFAVSKHMCVSSTPCTPIIPLKDIEPGRIGLVGDVKYCQSTGSSDDGYPFDNRTGSDCPKGIDCGCNQFKDFNRKIFGSTVLTGSANIDYTTSKTSSHIIKLVSNDYWRRDCIQQTQQKQNNVVYVGACSENVGNNDRGVSQGIRSYAKTCNSYAMNLNPQANRASGIHKCCAPKRSGPFLLESNYRNALFAAQKQSAPKPPKEPILEKVYDAPITISLFGDIPDYTLLNDNILYNLQNRIHCDCDLNGCFEYIPPIVIGTGGGTGGGGAGGGGSGGSGGSGGGSGGSGGSGGTDCGCFGLPFGSTCADATLSLSLPYSCSGSSSECTNNGFTCCCK